MEKLVTLFTKASPHLTSKNLLGTIAGLIISISLACLYSYIKNLESEKQRQATQIDQLKEQNFQQALLMKDLAHEKEMDSMKALIALKDFSHSKNIELIKAQYQSSILKENNSFKKRCEDSLVVNLYRIQTDFYDTKSSDGRFSYTANKFHQMQAVLDAVDFYAKPLDLSESVAPIVAKKRPYIRQRPEALKTTTVSN